MQIPIEAAYAEACQALGESVVRERLLVKALDQQAAQLKAVTDDSSKADADDQNKDNGAKKNGALSSI
jgi:hypothetical protein